MVVFFLRYGIEEIINKGECAVSRSGRSGWGCNRRTQLIMPCLNHLEKHLTISDIDGSPSEFFIESRVVKQIKILKQEQPCRLIVRVKSQQRTQFIQRIAVKTLRMMHQLYYPLHNLLPIGHRSIEYLVADVLNHLSDKLLLYGIKRLSSFITFGGSELLLKILRMVHIVGKSDIDSH